MALNDLQYLVLSVLLTWIMLMTASLMRARGWTADGMGLALGNRDDLPEPSPAAARADRAARNMLENLALFTALLSAARLAGADPDTLTLGAAIFFWARLAYFAVYLAGIKVVRTVIWGVSLVGLVMIARAAF